MRSKPFWFVRQKLSPATEGMCVKRRSRFGRVGAEVCPITCLLFVRRLVSQSEAVEELVGITQLDLYYENSQQSCVSSQAGGRLHSQQRRTKLKIIKTQVAKVLCYLHQSSAVPIQGVQV